VEQSGKAGGMFSGTYIHSLDAKNRLIIPSKLREKIDTSRDGTGFFVTYGFDACSCLYLYAPRQWNEELERYKRIPFTNKKARDVVRVILAKSHEVPCDSHGRVLIPEPLRAAVKIKKEIAIIGIINRIEIWDYETWVRREADVLPKLDDLADDLFKASPPGGDM